MSGRCEACGNELHGYEGPDSDPILCSPCSEKTIERIKGVVPARGALIDHAFPGEVNERPLADPGPTPAFRLDVTVYTKHGKRMTIYEGQFQDEDCAHEAARRWAIDYYPSAHRIKVVTL